MCRIDGGDINQKEYESKFINLEREKSRLSKGFITGLTEAFMSQVIYCAK